MEEIMSKSSKIHMVTKRSCIMCFNASDLSLAKIHMVTKPIRSIF